MIRTIRYTTLFSLALAGCLAIVVLGCGNGKPVAPAAPAGAQTPEETMGAWRNLVDSPGGSLDNPQLKSLASEIGRTSAPHVAEMIEMLDNADLSGEKLMALVTSLEEVVSPDTVPRLVEMTQSEKPKLVRGAATHLIALVQSPEATAALESLRNDESSTVQLAALLGLTVRGSAEARQELRDIYMRDDTTLVTRERIVISIAPMPTDDDVPLIEQAVQTEGFAQQTYLIAASALGRVGTLDSIAALDALKSDPNCSVGVSEMCAGSIAAIEERLGAEPAETS